MRYRGDGLPLDPEPMTNNPKPPKEDKLDEILDKFFIMRAATLDMSLEETKRRNELGEPEVELKAQINNYMKEEMLSLIGEDDGMVTGWENYWQARNILRAELRQAINERFK